MSDDTSTPEPSEARQRGLDMLEQVYGFPWNDIPDNDFFAVTADHLFADIWSRPGLEMSQRRLLLIALMAVQGQEATLQIQLGAALRNGELDATALREIVIFLAHYAGWPVAARLTMLVEQAIADHDG